MTQVPRSTAGNADLPRPGPVAVAVAAALWSIFLGPGPVAAQDTVGAATIRGTVVQGGGGTPQIVEICVAGTRQCVETGPAGHFTAINARPGRHRLEVRTRDGVTLVTAEVEVHAGHTTDLRLMLPEIAAIATSVTVSATERLAPDEVVTSGVLVQNRDIGKTAGVLQDVSRYVATLPGVLTGSADFRNDIIVRGGSPLENLFIVDNIEIPNINSFANLASAGGTVSLLDVQLIEEVTFLTGGYPAPYINRLSSVVQVTQREGSRDGFRAKATLAYAGAGGVLEGPWAGGKGSWLMSARRSFLDVFSDDIGTGGVPVYYSFTGKIVRDVGQRDRLWWTGIGGTDSIRLGLSPETEPGSALGELDIRYAGQRIASGINWQRLHGSRGVSLLGVTHSAAGVDSTVKDLLRSGGFGAGTPIEDVLAAGAVTFREDSSESETTIKYDLSLRDVAAVELRLGGAQKLFRNQYLVLSPLGYDGPFTTIPDINPINVSERIGPTQSSAYLQGTRHIGRRVRLTAGARLDTFVHLGTSRTRVSPRAGGSLALSENVAWNASWGVYHQMPPYLFLVTFPENRVLIPARSEHWVTGLSWAPDRNIRITLEAYSKRYDDYAVATQFPALSFANVGDTFDVRDILYPMASAGSGEARGVELFLEKKSGGSWFGQANLAYSRARHAGLDGIARPGAFDRPLAVNLVGGRRLGRKWEVAMRTTYLSGRPYTPFDLGVSRSQRRAVFDLGSVNALRFEAFFTLDLRLDYSFLVRDREVVAYVGLGNVTGRRNPAGIGWDRTGNVPRIQGGISRLPLVGLEWSF